MNPQEPKQTTLADILDPILAQLVARINSNAAFPFRPRTTPRRNPFVRGTFDDVREAMKVAVGC